MITAGQLAEHCKFVTGLAPIADATGTTDYVSMKGCDRCTVVVMVDNGTTVTGSAITLTQATAVAGTGAKVVSGSLDTRGGWKCIDTAAGDTLSALTVSSAAFTTDTTNAKNGIYIVDVLAEDLDVAGGFDCLSAVNASGANLVMSILYILWPLRYGATPSSQASAIVD
jgi:hypothetical protein